jgi:N-acetylglutamate synthase-like GNAT family acetyltransferase
LGIITVDENNIDTEHICCAITEKKGENCVGSKKAWMKKRFEDGLVFKKLDVRGKVFIEYIPCENAFAPIDGDGYMYINCFWVSGRYKNQGYANMLLEECIKDAKSKGKKGLAVLGSKKKMHFLSDPKFMKYKGFQVCDTASPSFELLYLPFEKVDYTPRFRDCDRTGMIDNKDVVIYYSNGCPHTDKYVPIVKSHLEQLNVPYEIIKLETLEQARNCKAPCTNYAVFMKGKFITSEVLTIKKMDKFLEKYYY